jgi:PAS domain S-box-containing protein
MNFKENSMQEKLRKTGIDVLGEVPWGSHFCQFYETKKDLLELLVPYFKAGLENNEYCLWIIANPMTIDDALDGLKKNVPHFQKYIERKSIEILPYVGWFMATGKFNAQQVNQAWLRKLDEVLARGYDGLRINGNETWVERNGWDKFMEYEQGLNSIFKNRRIIGLCTYPLSHSDGGMVLDVAHAHEAAIAKRKGRWEILEQPEIKKRKAELQQRGDELEQRVADRTKELAQAVGQLQKEIDERKSAEGKLRQSESLLMEAERLACVGSWNIDLSNKAVTWSDEVYKIFGVAPTEFDLTLETAIGFTRPADKDFLDGVIEEAVTTHEQFDFYHSIIRPDGEERIIHVHGAVATDEQGNVTRLYGAMQDVTESKKAEDELRLAYQRLSYHVENTPLAVIELDKDLFIKRWSKRAEEIFGWKASEALGKNVYDTDFPIIFKEDMQAVDEINEQLMTGMVNSNQSLNRNYTKDGKVIYNEWYNSVLRDDHGNVITILSLVHDVTERKQSEEEIQEATNRLRDLSAHLQNIREEERTRIAREIHDEFGAQLTVLKLDASWLDKKLISANDAVKQKVKDILGLIDTTGKLVRRISANLRPSLLDQFGLGAAIEWYLEEFKKRSGIKFFFNEPEERLQLEDSVKTGLYSIFQESLTNIAKHSEAKKVWIKLAVKKEELVMSIRDNGKGFDKQLLNKKKTLGILGMKERTIMMKGKYEIDSVPERGTTVTVTIPYKKEET